MNFEVTGLERSILSVAVTEYLKKHHSSEDTEIIAIAGTLATRLREGKRWEEPVERKRRKSSSTTSELPTDTQLKALLALADRCSAMELTGPPSKSN